MSSGWMHICSVLAYLSQYLRPLVRMMKILSIVQTPIYSNSFKRSNISTKYFSREVESLKSSNAESVGNSQTPPVPYSSVVERNTPDKLPNKISRSQSNPSQVPNRKFNLVVYGVKGKPKGSPKHTRLIEDVH